MLIGITGGIGAGKSVVSRILRLKGYSVYDCDMRARQLMEESEDIRRELISHFGCEAITPAGAIDRAFIAAKVFANDSDRMWLNSLVHGAVRDDLARWTDKRGGALCFVESAIMVTSGLDKMCDAVWHVDAPEEVRIERAVKRGGVAKENIALRIEAQRGEFDALPAERTFVINNVDSESLLAQIDRCLDGYLVR